jgi:putative ABC transport system permease protein
MTWVIVYFQVVSLALALGMQPSDLRLLTGLFVLIMLGMPALIGRLTGRSTETFAGGQR